MNLFELFGMRPPERDPEPVKFTINGAELKAVIAALVEVAAALNRRRALTDAIGSKISEAISALQTVLDRE